MSSFIKYLMLLFFCLIINCSDNEINENLSQINKKYASFISPIDKFIIRGTTLEIKIKQILLNNERYKYELVEKGFISPDRNTIINKIDFETKLKNLIQKNKNIEPQILSEKFMHLLGASNKDLKGILRQAYDCSFYPASIRGQNRIAYTRMANHDYQHGLMLGGLGTGGLERTPSGIFRRVAFTYAGQNVEDKENNMASQFHIYLKTNSIGWINYDKSIDKDFPHPPKKEGLHLMGEANKADYSHVETFDVRSYSFTRALFWPKLENNIMEYYAEAVKQEDSVDIYFRYYDYYKKEMALKPYTIKIKKTKDEKVLKTLKLERKMLKNALNNIRKPRWAIPHDIWSIEKGPFYNSYTHQNSNLFPGMHQRGILQLLRNYMINKNKKALLKQYRAFSKSLDYALKNLDINNDTIPDFCVPPNKHHIALWTYDTWEWSYKDGINAYTAGLWLTGLAAAKKCAQILNIKKDINKYQHLLKRGKKLYDNALWKQIDNKNGYYKLGSNVDDIFTDTLHFFYAKSLGLKVFNPDKVKMHLNTIYQANVKQIGHGYLGAINGTRNNELIDGEQQN